ncbi:hypothetical protein APHAL10511_004697 [Amanita phalloides]|nr:hypothetical protein APHAL10511_004697 [Amanita phalloides]
MPLPSRSFSLCTLIWLSILLASVQTAHAAAQNKDTDMQKGMHMRMHSLYAPYIDQDLQNRWWDFGADAHVNTNKHVRLTRPAPSQMGWLWSRLPIVVSDFVVEFEFKVSGESNHFGDGIAFWLTTERAQPGPIYGSKDKFTGLGVFLDTFANTRHEYAFPRISGMIGNGQTSYDFGNDGDDQVVGACSANFRRTDVVTKMKVAVVKGKYIDVKMQYKAWDEWTDCFRIHNVTLPSTPFVGFSAMTGDVFDAHDIIAVTSYSIMPGVNTAQDNKSWNGNRPHSSAAGMSWFGLLFRVVLFAGLCFGIYYAYQEYQRRTMYGGGANFGAPKNGFGSGGSRGFGSPYENRRRF